MVGNSSKDMAIVRLVPREEGEAECSIPSPTHGRYKNICPERNIAGVDGSVKANLTFNAQEVLEPGAGQEGAACYEDNVVRPVAGGLPLAQLQKML